MTINWFGHSCFRIEAKEGALAGSEGVSILLDPFSKEIGLKPPKIKDDIVLVSHDHYDHNNLEGLNDGVFVIDSPGEYEKRGVAIRGVSSFHDNSKGSERGLNTIFIIKAEGMTICHLGDLGQGKLEDQQVGDIGDVDILMVPVGGKYTIDYKQAVSVINQIGPKVVIPMHYKVNDLKIDIDGQDKFVKEMGISPENVDKLKIQKKTLPTEETKLVIFR